MQISYWAKRFGEMQSYHEILTLDTDNIPDLAYIGTTVSLMQVETDILIRPVFESLGSIRPLQYERVVVIRTNSCIEDQDWAETRTGPVTKVLTTFSWFKRYHEWIFDTRPLFMCEINICHQILSRSGSTTEQSLPLILRAYIPREWYTETGFFVETPRPSDRWLLMLRYIMTKLFYLSNSELLRTEESPQAVIEWWAGNAFNYGGVLSFNSPSSWIGAPPSVSVPAGHTRNLAVIVGRACHRLERLAHLNPDEYSEDDHDDFSPQFEPEIPPVYNSNGYDKLVTLPLCKGYDNSRRFGLEFEFINETIQDHYYDYLRAALTSSRWPVESYGYMHSAGTSWDLKTDSSCGYELATPALCWEDWTLVEKALNSLREAGANVNASCGVHIHHEARDLGVPGIRRLLLLWAAVENLFFDMTYPNRVGNDFCQPIAHLAGGINTWEGWMFRVQDSFGLEQLISEIGKYTTLNLRTWWQHGRVEFRLFHGTLQEPVIKYWVLMTQQLVEAALRVQSLDTIRALYESKDKGKEKRLKAFLSLHLRENENVKALPKVMDTFIQSFS